MKLVFQKQPPSPDQAGDCFQACIASMLDLELKDVPHFFEGIRNGAEVPFLARVRLIGWLAHHGLIHVEIGFRSDMTTITKELGTQSPGLVFLLTGCTAEGLLHTVVIGLTGKGNTLVHDPACPPGTEKRTVLVKPCPDGTYRVGLLVRHFAARG